MECRDAKLLIEAWWDRELPAEDVAAAQAHLGQCLACRTELGPVTALLTRPEPVPVPAGLRDRILASVQAAPSVPADADPGVRPSRWVRWAQAPWAGALAACLAFMVMGWVASMVRSPGEPNAISAAAAPSPALLMSWAQAMALRGQANPVGIAAHALALEHFTTPPSGAPAIFVRGRPVLEEPKPLDPASAIPELPIIVVGLSTLGA